MTFDDRCLFISGVVLSAPIIKDRCNLLEKPLQYLALMGIDLTITIMPRALLCSNVGD